MMKTTKHNPDYKLVSFTFNGKQFVIGQTNKGDNLGLEVYYGAPNHYYSRRFLRRQIPMIYNELAERLIKFLPFCKPGCRLEVERKEVFNQ